MLRGEDFGPIIFEPIFVERIWGGQKLRSLYHKNIPDDRPIGESWEIVDRAQAQSVAKTGPCAGRSLHDLWMNFRPEIFSNVRDAPRFPLLIKLLDCRQKLSLQVHPPPELAGTLRGEPKTECWYVADASPEAEIYLGLRNTIAPDLVRKAIADGTVAELLHRVSVETGDAFFIPSGRIHAIGAGNVIVEVQQNSDTTFRVFDWNRTDAAGRSRKLHLEEAMRCIDFTDCSPTSLTVKEEKVLSHELFTIERWHLLSSRELVPVGTFAIVFCLTGSIRCGPIQCRPGDFFLLPAVTKERIVAPSAPDTSLLRITIEG
jgi:mannose-6-phosphate isomerase